MWKLCQLQPRVCKAFALLLLCGGGAGACAAAGSAAGVHAEVGPPPEPLAQVALNDAASGMTVGAGDVFEIKVFQDKDLSSVFMVGREGLINFPLLGPLYVRGMTPGQVAELVRTRLADGYIRDPVVSVFMKQANSKKIFVLGQVAKPGAFAFVDEMSIVQALTLAGGFSKVAAQDSTNVTRREGDVERKYTIPITKILDGARSNFLLKPGDIVFVPESMF